jgi:hypothetical protein
MTLQLKHALIAFHRMCGGHDGKSMAELGMAMVDRAGITANVSELTLNYHLTKKNFRGDIGHWTMLQAI